MAVLLGLFLLGLCGCTRSKNGETILGGGGSHTEDLSDAYRCAVSTAFQMELSRGEGYSVASLGLGSAVKYRVFQTDQEEVRMEVAVATSDGGLKRFEWSRDDDRQVFGAGPIAGAEAFVTLCEEFGEESAPSGCYLERRSADGEVMDRVLLEGFKDHFYAGSTSVIVDGNGYAHVSDGEGSYCIFAPDGSLFQGREFARRDFCGLALLPDGRVACDVLGQSGQDSSLERHHRVECTDTKSGEVELVFEYAQGGVSENPNVFMINVFNDDKLVYGDGEGIWLCDYSMKNAERIFTWKRDGMSVQEPLVGRYGICADDEGNVFVLCDTNEGSSFLELTPAPENVYEIELAASVHFPDYFKAVQEFNKKYPEYRITIRDDYDETALLTRLTAGDGPVIIDASLIPFREQEKLWEPLANLVDAATLGELNQAAVKLGSIHGTTYGAVSNFNVNTLVTLEDVADWDYEEVIRRAEGREDLKAIIASGGWDKAAAMNALFNGGAGDTFFVNAETSDAVIDAERLRKVISLINQYGPDRVASEEALAEFKAGKILCAPAVLSEPASLCQLKLMYGEQAKIAGYPHADGGASHLVSAGILAVRRNASEEEKKIASAFFQILFSYEVQLKTVDRLNNCSFSVRKDVLEEQIKMAKELEGVIFSIGGEEYRYDEIDVEELRKETFAMLDHSVPVPDRKSGYNDIIREELDSYFSGSVTEEMLIDHLNKRIGLYLKERE